MGVAQYSGIENVKNEFALAFLAALKTQIPSEFVQMKKDYSDYLSFKKWMLIYLKPLLLAPSELATDDFIHDVIELMITSIKECPPCEYKQKVFFILYIWKLVHVVDSNNP